MVVGGRWHDLDFARRELLALVGDHDAVRCSVHSDYSDIRRLSSVDAVIAYTCDVRPTAAEAAALASMLHEGGRLLALHATNSAIDPPPDEGPRIFSTPNAMPEFTALLGNRFLAHPKIGPFLIEPVKPAHPLVSGVTSFTTVDEIYVSELAADLDVVLETDGAVKEGIDRLQPTKFVQLLGLLEHSAPGGDRVGGALPVALKRQRLHTVKVGSSLTQRRHGGQNHGDSEQRVA